MFLIILIKSLIIGVLVGVGGGALGLLAKKTVVYTVLAP